MGNGSALGRWFFVLYSVILTVFAYVLVAPWRLDIADAKLYIESGRSLRASKSLGTDLIFAPFFRKEAPSVVLAPEAKPVFMAAYNIFNAAIFSIVGEKRARYFLFVLVLHALFLFTVGSFAVRLGCARSGVMVMGVLALSPWTYIYLYYPAYTQASIALLFLLMRFLLLEPARIGLASFLSFALLLCNSSIAIYIFPQWVAYFFMNLREPRRGMRILWDVMVGLCLPFCCLELLTWTPLPNWWLGSQGEVDGPITLLFKYYDRAVTANSFLARGTQVPKNIFIPFYILSENLWTVNGLLFLGTIMFLMKKLLRKGRTFGKGWSPKENLLPFWAGCLIPVVFAWSLLGFHPKLVQLGRFYFIGFPFILLVAFCGLEGILGKKVGVTFLAMAAVICGEATFRLYDQRQAFHALESTFGRYTEMGKKVAFFKEDIHHGILLHLLSESHHDSTAVVSEESNWAEEARRQDVQAIITGPELATMTTGWASVHKEDPEVSYGRTIRRGKFQFGMDALTVEEPVKIPYFGVYPLLLFEDEINTWRYLWGKISHADYRTGLGTVKLWPLRPQTKGLSLYNFPVNQ